MQHNPVNSIQADANVIKVNDTGSQIKLTFKNGNGETVNMQNNIDYFYLTPDKREYYPVTDISFEGDAVLFRPPSLLKGYYYIEVKDTSGNIYPAGQDVVIHMKASFESGEEAEYISYRQAIVEDVEPIIVQHLTDNRELYQGEKGDIGPQGPQGEQGIQGPQGERGEQGEKGDTLLAEPKVYTREEYNNLTDYDPNTLYFIKDV